MAKQIQHKKVLFQSIKSLIEEAKQYVVRNINTTLLVTNFEIGRMIVEEEQNGKHRADYAKQIVLQLSKDLMKEFGRGYSVSNLEYFRKFYLIYSLAISQSATGKSKIVSNSALAMRNLISQQKPQSLTGRFKFSSLSWTHYVQLLKIEDDNERAFYEIEAAENNWSVRELQRQYESALYERLSLSKDKKGAKKLAEKGHMIENVTDVLKTSYVLEFLDLREDNRYTETDLETAIINKLEQFMLELGKGFCFVGRQKRFTFENDSFFVDLVFYNRLLKCFVIIDLKIGKLTHQDIGQMQMYVNYYDRMIKQKEENATIGIILCREKNKAVVEFTFPQSQKQIFTKEYKLYLPSKKALLKQLQ